MLTNTATSSTAKAKGPRKFSNSRVETAVQMLPPACLADMADKTTSKTRLVDGSGRKRERKKLSLPKSRESLATRSKPSSSPVRRRRHSAAAVAPAAIAPAEVPPIFLNQYSVESLCTASG